jgi:hypothetical protein
LCSAVTDAIVRTAFASLSAPPVNGSSAPVRKPDCGAYRGTYRRKERVHQGKTRPRKVRLIQPQRKYVNHLPLVGVVCDLVEAPAD